MGRSSLEGSRDMTHEEYTKKLEELVKQFSRVLANLPVGILGCSLCEGTGENEAGDVCIACEGAGNLNSFLNQKKKQV